MKLLPITISCAAIALSLSACTMYDTFDGDLVAGHADAVSSSDPEPDAKSSSSETVESSSSEKKTESSSSEIPAASSSSEKPATSSSSEKTAESSSSESPIASSSSETLSSSSVASGCGDEVTDARDGNVYKVVKIGSQCWTARNMDYKIDETSACYDDDDSNCVMYGRLYTWDGATDACPAGFHLPTEEEWQTLITYAKGTTAGYLLKAVDAWGKAGLKDGLGFTALPAGFNNGIKYIGLSTKGFWWTKTEVDASEAKYTTMSTANDEVNVISTEKAQMLSVRCVKN